MDIIIIVPSLFMIISNPCRSTNYNRCSIFFHIHKSSRRRRMARAPRQEQDENSQDNPQNSASHCLQNRIKPGFIPSAYSRTSAKRIFPIAIEKDYERVAVHRIVVAINPVGTKNTEKVVQYLLFTKKAQIKHKIQIKRWYNTTF